MIPEAERISTREIKIGYKRSHGNDDRILVMKITTGGVQDTIRLIQLRISEI